MPISLEFPDANSVDYVDKNNDNFTIIQNAINSLQSAISGLGGDGSALVFDQYDRGGIVGPHSYQLDLTAYAGGDLITIGRRPAFVSPEVNQSVAAFTSGGSYLRVSQVGDVVLNAGGIVSGLPKTIYVGVSSSGTPGLFENTLTPNTLYIWSMTWDGVDMTDFRRIAPILPSYTLLQGVAGQPQSFQVWDGETDFTVASGTSITRIMIPGGAAGNGINLAGAYEVLGFFAHVGDADPDGFYSPVPGTAPQAKVEFDVYSGADKWSATPLAIDTDNQPVSSFAAVLGGIGDDRFVFQPRHFKLKQVSAGANVVSARGLLWGVYARPIYGSTESPKTFATGNLV